MNHYLVWFMAKRYINSVRYLVQQTNDSGGAMRFNTDGVLSSLRG
jgi:hypothetical protein